MIVFVRRIDLIMSCLLVGGILQGMQPQVQSTSSIVSSNAQAQTSNVAESTAIAVPTVQRQSALIGSLSSQPFFKGVDQQLLQDFMRAIADKDDGALEDFFNHYSVVYPLIKTLVYTGCFDHLDRMFDYIETYDLPFDINAIPVGESDLLIVVACFQLSTYRGTVREGTYKKIVELLLEEGANITYFVQRDLIPWVTLLLKLSADVQVFNDYGGSRLYGVCCSEEMKKILDDAHIAQFQSGSCYKALVIAVENNDTAAAVAAIHQGAKAHALFTKDGSHVLSAAARNNNKKLTELLLTFADCTLDYLVATNDYESLQFIFTELKNYSISLAECKRLLGIVANSKKNLVHVKALLDKQRQCLESRMTDDDEKEIANMTSNPFGQIRFTKSETDFIFAVSQYRYKKAQAILAQDSNVRLTLIEIAEKNLMTFILSDPLTSQRTEDQKAFVAFLLKNHFNQLYPLIQDMVRKHQYQFIEQLIKYGLDVNAHALIPGTDNIPDGRPAAACSLLRVAVEQAAVTQENKADIAMIVFLLKSGASIAEYLEEKGNGLLLSLPEVQVLLEAGELYNAPLWKVLRVLLQKMRDSQEMTAWDLGMVLYNIFVPSEGVLDASNVLNALPDVTRVAKNNSRKTVHKRHLDEEQKADSEERPLKRERLNEHKEADADNQQQTTAPRISLTPSLETIHMAPHITSPTHFDPSRWLNAVSIDVAKS